ncbi:hypothetical protein BKH42_03460 [Helicobacter sp. 13S00482-2]|uniref:thioredoxin fold domain-containing protein n=1 Tax=Helicobacter sp. 13S00482-2 TaxID=1476200 RepID=UPI000BA55963|nr:thioredoxin fold domain-containing protein [Helicobacter sp. 13S00482-2]PAF53798.1 hypothetical protein BKH42_03460 [Helicobacter sp. 13S00482-2]
MLKNKLIALIATTLVSLSPLGANSLSKKIEETIFEKTNTQVKVIKVKPIDIKKLNLSIIEINNNQLALFSSDDGKTIFGMPEIFVTSDQKVLDATQETIRETQAYNSRGKQERLLEAFKKYPSNIVYLSSGVATNKTTYIVTDPNCPYCKDEMQRIDDILQNSNVALIFVGIIGHQNSEIKSADILQYTQDVLKNKKNQKNKEEEILNHIKKVYFDSSYKPVVKDVSQAKENSKMVIDAGINAVPYKFVTDKKIKD